MSERLALFGGSFNPPHVGHALAIHYCLACLPIDRVWMVPTYEHAFGKALIDYETRLEMCRRAVAPLGGGVLVSDLERRLGGESRTIRLVDHLLAEDPGRALHLVVGSDILDQLERWLEVERLLSLVHLVVLDRVGHERDDPRVFGVPLPEVSSTLLRERLAAGDVAGCRGLIPGPTLDLIVERDLYGEG